jgi:hypothetical protein
MKLGVYPDTKPKPVTKLIVRNRPQAFNFKHLGESKGAIVHDGAGVIGGAEVVDLVEVVLHEVIAHVTHDVVPQDLHVVIAVSAGLLVPEA